VAAFLFLILALAAAALALAARVMFDDRVLKRQWQLEDGRARHVRRIGISLCGAAMGLLVLGAWLFAPPQWMHAHPMLFMRWMVVLWAVLCAFLMFPGFSRLVAWAVWRGRDDEN
jgi:hypothetical protein